MWPLLFEHYLAPECPFPAAFDDALAAYGWVWHHGEPAPHRLSGRLRQRRPRAGDPAGPEGLLYDLASQRRRRDLLVWRISLEISVNDIDDLKHLIRSAFHGVQLGTGIGLTEAEGMDNRECDWELAQHRATDEKEHWEAIDPEALNTCNASLSYFDPLGMRFHLPAFMIAELDGAYRLDLDPVLAGEPARNEQFSLFTSQQREAVAAYLRYVQAREVLEDCRQAMQRALDTFWAKRSST